MIIVPYPPTLEYFLIDILKNWIEIVKKILLLIINSAMNAELYLPKIISLGKVVTRPSGMRYVKIKPGSPVNTLTGTWYTDLNCGIISFMFCNLSTQNERVAKMNHQL